MMMLAVMMTMAESTALRLEGNLDFVKVRSETKKHFFDHMVGRNPKNVVLNLRRQISIP
jgi:hypothetical protein